ncbi:hypothetical protein BDW74DRAFT_190234 [Aspergillus multicolor]|uniref:cytochrome P450 n=1 Tax=Aspergillus multicolor TaxID=41759 RepID=UPI003CCCCC5F
MEAMITALHDTGPYTRLAIFIFGTFTFLSIAWYFQGKQDPTGIPYIGQPPGKTGFSLRTYYRYYTDCSRLMREAYDKYLKHGKPVWIPGLGARKELILPNSSMKWALAQPSRILNHRAGLLDVDFPEYLLGDVLFLNDPWHGHLVKSELMPEIDGVCAVMNDEIGAAFDEYFGGETETDTQRWREIDVLEIMRLVIGRAAGRFIVGEPLCRNEAYIKHVYDMVDKMHLSTGILLLSPRILHPILGPVIRYLANRRFDKLSRMIEAEYHARLGSLQSVQKEQPNDFFQSFLRYAQKERPHELNLYAMTRRLFLANLGSMHRTAFLTTNVLLNIIDSDGEYNTIGNLRDEISRVLSEDGMSATDVSSWNRPRSTKLFRAESLARETMRLQSFDNRSTICKVLADGVTMGDGTVLPRGARVSFLGHPAQIDESVYEDAEKFDPFRFSRSHEAITEGDKVQVKAEGLGKADEGKKAGLGAQSFVSTGPYHLPFGHGRTACPGRWVVDFEVKMIVAYAVSRYELEFPTEYNGKRPDVTWMVESMLPPKGARVRVRRRKA